MTVDAAEATKKYQVAVKCATITPDEARVKEFGLKKMWLRCVRQAAGVADHAQSQRHDPQYVRALKPTQMLTPSLGGVVFREPIVVEKIPRPVPAWTKPIIVGRHAFGDQYRATDMKIPEPGKVELVYTPADGSEVQRKTLFDFKSAGVVLGMYNLRQSITDFAHASFKQALQKKLPMYMSTKVGGELSRRWLTLQNTILKGYDGTWKDMHVSLASSLLTLAASKRSMSRRTRPTSRRPGCGTSIAW